MDIELRKAELGKKYKLLGGSDLNSHWIGVEIIVLSKHINDSSVYVEISKTNSNVSTANLGRRIYLTNRTMAQLIDDLPNDIMKDHWI